MEKASSVFYLIAGIFSAVATVVYIIFAILAFMGNLNVVVNGQDARVAYGIAFIFVALIYCLVALFAFHGHKLNKIDSPKKGLHIFAIVFGAVTLDPFFILAGVFGLLGANQ